MEILAQLNATALPSGLSTKQASAVASPPAGQGERTSPPQGVVNTGLKFTVYDKNKIAVSVIDKESGDIIREIPPEQLQKLSEQMGEIIGRFVDQIA
jgi:flagellar protein FlaG